MDIKKMYVLSKITLKNEGFIEVFRKSFAYLKRRIDYLTKNDKDLTSYKDVLIINGCSLNHPFRYRVLHKKEQLEFANYSTDYIEQEKLSNKYIKYYRTFIFYRCELNEEIEKFIKEAKKFNKVIFFDIDDLVIDEKYVLEQKYICEMSKEQYSIYINGVRNTTKLMELCDYGITSTEGLRNELLNYFPEVCLNKNVANENMVRLSLDAIENKKKLSEEVVIGYFSGSITHNEDLEIISNVLKRVLKENSNVKLLLMGIIDIPEVFKEVESQIIVKKFHHYNKLPKLISEIDINIVPLNKSIFNDSKSENKWMEAALVKVMTIASYVGPFKSLIENGINGCVCKNEEEWYVNITEYIQDEIKRNQIAKTAHEQVIETYTTCGTALELTNFIEKHIKKNVVYILPTTEVGGGVNVVKKHASILKSKDFDVLLASKEVDSKNIFIDGDELNVISLEHTKMESFINKCVSTIWSSVDFSLKYEKVKDIYYLVQNYETDFYKHGNERRKFANITYNAFKNINYITISKWCEKWLKNNYGKISRCSTNGIDLKYFPFVNRNFNGKIRILIEGSSSHHYKNVDESFLISNELDREKFEVWYVTNDGKAKDWYKYDKMFHKIPHEEMGKILGQCHILLKSSFLESFSYAPLEIMATGGVSVLTRNDGNIEYLNHEENCLFYELGNYKDAIECINRICNDDSLRKKIIENGMKTANRMSWDYIENSILDLYK